MIREVTMEEISDGKRYGANDMVKADCRGCEGCSACCHGMGNSVILDPYDIYELEKGLKKGFEELLAGALELHVADGIILPNLKMAGEGEACVFLNEAGRCTIHGFRPGFCRLFPLGRVYEGGGFRYFLQTHECKKTDRTKVKVKKWLGIPELSRYEDFVLAWRNLLADLRGRVVKDPESQEAREVCMNLLKIFYMRPYDMGRDFYAQFEERMQEMGSMK